MSKFSNSSLGRDSSRMGPGPSGRDRGLDSGSKMSPQRFRGMSSGSSPQIGRGLASSAREDPASSLLARFGLSSSDLEELSRYPEEKITSDNLPEIIQHLKRRRSEHMEMSSNRDRLSRNEPGSLRRASFDDRPSGLDPLGDFGRGGSSRDLAYRERYIDDALRDRERRVDRFLSELSFRKSESEFDRARGMPSVRNIDDFRGTPPKVYPHLCSLCDLPLNSFQSWDAHFSGKLHQKSRWRLLDLYPQWKGHGMGGSRESGNMGPPPPPMGGHGGRPGPQGMPGPGPRPVQRKQGTGRVIHILDFERRSNLKSKLLKLVEPFGTVTNSLILNTKNEAFIEMSAPAEARAAVDYYEMSPAHLYGKPLRVFLSVKYKQIKKDGNDAKTQSKAPKPPLKQGPKKPFKPGAKPTPVEGIGRVLRICNLPQAGYSDDSVLKLAKDFGTVKTYILMRKSRQAFVEMEKAEDAQTMVDRSAKTPLKFKGKPLKILISQKYKTLVLRIPNSAHNRKRESESKGDKKKPKKEKADKSDKADVVTTEEDLVTGSCEEDEEAIAALEESDSGEEAEAADEHNDVSKSQIERVSAFHEPMEGFVTLDEIGSEPVKKENGVDAEQPMEVDKPKATETTAASEGELTAEDLGPYQPNVPIGVSYVIPKTGFYCRLCSLFYTNEDMAKVTHCSSLTHYQNVKKLLNKPSTEKSPIKTEQ